MGLSELGRCAKYGSNVLPAVAKRPSRPVRSFRTHASRCGFGSEQCGTSFAEERSQRLGFATRSGTGQLPNRLGLDAQAAAGDGAAGARTGVVEVDETYWGAEEEGVRGRQIERKGLIAVRRREAAGWGGSVACLMPFVEESRAAAGSNLLRATDPIAQCAKASCGSKASRGATSIWTTIWTNSSSGSTGAADDPANAVRVAPRIVRIYTLSLSLRTRLRLSWYSP